MNQLENHYLSVMLYKRIVIRKGYRKCKKQFGVARNSILFYLCHQTYRPYLAQFVIVQFIAPPILAMTKSIFNTYGNLRAFHPSI